MSNYYYYTYKCSECGHLNEKVFITNSPRKSLNTHCRGCYKQTFMDRVNKLDKQEQDIINKPQHYNEGGVETIEVIEAKFGGPDTEFTQGYLLGNVLKYVTRCRYKGKYVEDLKKAQYYLNRLISNLEKNEKH